MCFVQVLKLDQDNDIKKIITQKSRMAYDVKMSGKGSLAHLKKQSVSFYAAAQALIECHAIRLSFLFGGMNS